MSESTARWLTYDFTVYGPNTTWNEVSGVYIFTGLGANNRWNAYYIGKANTFKTRLGSDHEQWDPARKLGATHVHVMVVPLEANRQSIEKELIAACQPPLNTHHK